MSLILKGGGGHSLLVLFHLFSFGVFMFFLFFTEASCTLYGVTFILPIYLFNVYDHEISCYLLTVSDVNVSPGHNFIIR